MLTKFTTKTPIFSTEKLFLMNFSMYKLILIASLFSFWLPMITISYEQTLKKKSVLDLPWFFCIRFHFLYHYLLFNVSLTIGHGEKNPWDIYSLACFNNYFKSSSFYFFFKLKNFSNVILIFELTLTSGCVWWLKHYFINR